MLENFHHNFQVILLSRIVLFAMTFLFNGIMWTLFVKSMRNMSSAQAMITNSASNFISSVSLHVYIACNHLKVQLNF